MATKPVYLFPLMPGSLTDETKIPIAQRSNAESPEDQHITPRKIADYLEADGFQKTIPGPYAGDSAAATAGVGIGESYRLSEENDYDMRSPDGRLVVTRIA